jgi:hypothetical protein
VACECSFLASPLQIPYLYAVVFTARSQPLTIRVESDSPDGGVVLKVKVSGSALTNKGLTQPIPEADCPIIRSRRKTEVIWAELDAADGAVTSPEVMQNPFFLQVPEPDPAVRGGDGQE